MISYKNMAYIDGRPLDMLGIYIGKSLADGKWARGRAAFYVEANGMYLWFINSMKNPESTYLVDADTIVLDTTRQEFMDTQYEYLLAWACKDWPKARELKGMLDTIRKKMEEFL